MFIGDIKVTIKTGDITEERVDAIVNAANNTLLGGGGVDGAIHRKGGPAILEQCKKHGGCPTGEARLTTAGNLPSRYVIHTVGPIYGSNGNRDELLLYNAYFNSLKLAAEYNLQTISFPSISTGAYGYPIDKAVKVVVSALTEFSKNKFSLKEVNFVLFNDKDYSVYVNYFNSID
ncbi:MAG: O-acetyl-ADP-ribose deacetylase [Gudongella sp.]|nr:O-acetyl-ADP-ribose deacetylase [Gudongella sp.]